MSFGHILQFFVKNLSNTLGKIYNFFNWTQGKSNLKTKIQGKLGKVNYKISMTFVLSHKYICFIYVNENP